MNTAIIDADGTVRDSNSRDHQNSECAVQANLWGRTLDVWRIYAQMSLTCPSLSFGSIDETMKPNLTPDSNETLKECSDHVPRFQLVRFFFYFRDASADPDLLTLRTPSEAMRSPL